MSSRHPSAPRSPHSHAVALRGGLVLAVALACAVGTNALGAEAREQRSAWPPAAEYADFLFPPSVSPVLFAGYRQLAADVYWARTLVHNGSSLVGEADFRYLERFLDNVIALDPMFERVYKWGALAVTYRHEVATQEEFRMAVRYLEKGMRAFPDKYEMFYTAGLRYYLDLWSEDPEELQRFRERGVELIEQAMRKKDAPSTLATFAASLRTRMGQRERALHDLREMILTTDNEAAQQKLIERYNQISESVFPEEAQRAKEAFEAAWRRELPYTSPSLYVILGDRPSRVIDFDRLATERDLFGADLEDLEDPDFFTRAPVPADEHHAPSADAPDEHHAPSADAPDEHHAPSADTPDDSGSAPAPAPPEAQHLP